MGFFRDVVDEIKYAATSALKGAAIIGIMGICVVVGFNAHDISHENNTTNNPEMDHIDDVKQEPVAEYAQELFNDPTKFHTYP